MGHADAVAHALKEFENMGMEVSARIILHTA
jgi:hypothetical protein